MLRWQLKNIYFAIIVLDSFSLSIESCKGFKTSKIFSEIIHAWMNSRTAVIPVLPWIHELKNQSACGE